MKKEFINKWKSWWIFQKQEKELTDAFERELNAIIKQEAEVASKNLALTDIKAGLLSFLLWFRANGAMHIGKSMEAVIEIYLIERGLF